MTVIKSRTLRNAICGFVPFVIVPALAVMGTLVFNAKRHLIISIAIAAFAFLLFSAGFERKSTGTRRMVITAVMTALSIVGRLIPFFKPVAAITIISAMYLGSEAGFLVGALSAILSNFYFGQGPWTAFQMLAWGLIGFMAGVFAEYLKKNKAILLTFGVVSGVAYSFIMDIWTVLWYNGEFDIKLYLAALASAVNYTVSYAVSNFIYLAALSKPFGEKLGRIKIKYGI